jgi:DNA-directed RNA polymerase specialized sigma24 family protein
LYGYGEERELRTNDHSPERPVLVKEEVGRALRLIEKGLVKRSEARAIKLRYMNNWGPKDVADEMGVNVRSVSRYVSVGLKRIRLLMKAK